MLLTIQEVNLIPKNLFELICGEIIFFLRQNRYKDRIRINKKLVQDN